MNIEQGISNDEMVFVSTFVIPCSLFDIQLSLTCYQWQFSKSLIKRFNYRIMDNRTQPYQLNIFPRWVNAVG